MISFIRGTAHHMENEAVTVLVGNIGYRVNVPRNVLESLQLEQETELYTYQHVREDALDLYGFQDRGSLTLFRQLISVSGVGPRLGLLILSQVDSEDLKRAIIHKDTGTLTAISGVGKKTAERIVLDLQESVAVGSPEDMVVAAAAGAAQLSTLDALLSLGYSRAEGLAAIQNIDSEGTLEEQVRASLKYLSS